MKINPDLYIPGANGVKAGSEGRKSSEAGTFSNLLDQLSASGAANGKDQAQSIFETGATSGIMQEAPVHTSAQADALAAGSQALELLDHLGAMLQQMDSSNSSLDSVASALEDEVGMLADYKETLEINDPLRGAIDEIGVMSIVASMKIERGDFSL